MVAILRIYFYIKALYFMGHLIMWYEKLCCNKLIEGRLVFKFCNRNATEAFAKTVNEGNQLHIDFSFDFLPYKLLKIIIIYWTGKTNLVQLIANGLLYNRAIVFYQLPRSKLPAMKTSLTYN